MASRRDPKREPVLSLLPMQLRPGDRITDPDGEWEIVAGPWGLHGGKTMDARVARPGDPRATKHITWAAAHEKIVFTTESRDCLMRHLADTAVVTLDYLEGATAGKIGARDTYVIECDPLTAQLLRDVAERHCKFAVHDITLAIRRYRAQQRPKRPPRRDD